MKKIDILKINSDINLNVSDSFCSLKIPMESALRNGANLNNQ